MSEGPASDRITAYLDWYVDRNPVFADGLDDFSAAGFNSREREAAEWLARSKTEPDAPT